MTYQSEIVFVALKKLLKDRGITYRQLGKHLGCSEAAVKNMIHKRSIDLERLEGICELFGISIFDFMNMAGQHQSADFELSELQEQFFVDNPGHFAFFCSLLFDRLSPAQIARKHHLKPTSTHRYVRDLEKLELIEQRSETQILFRKKGRLVWRKCGPWMRRHFANLARLQADIMTKQAINPGYFLNFGLFSLKPRDRDDFYRDTQALLDRYKSLAYQQSMGPDDGERVPISWNFMAMPEIIEVSSPIIPNI